MSTREIPLTRGYFAIVDKADFAAASQFKWHASPKGKTVYAERWVPRSNGSRKRQSLQNFLIECPDGFEVDHKDLDGLNNRRDNLRIATRRQNLQNRRHFSTAKSPFKGVRLRRNRWQARAGSPRQVPLGNFDTAEEAARAYDAAALALFGEFARLNFPAQTGTA